MEVSVITVVTNVVTQLEIHMLKINSELTPIDFIRLLKIPLRETKVTLIQHTLKIAFL
jgi:hypothetical protein